MSCCHKNEVSRHKEAQTPVLTSARGASGHLLVICTPRPSSSSTAPRRRRGRALMYYRELKKTQKTDDQTPRAKPDAPRRVAAVSPDVEGLGEMDLKALNLKEDHRDDPLVVELRRDIRRSFMVLDEPPKNVAPVSPAPSYLSMIFCASDIDWDFCSSYPRARRVRRRETIRAATSFFFVGQRLSRRTTRPRASTTTRATPTTSTTTRATSCSHIFPPRRSNNLREPRVRGRRFGRAAGLLWLCVEATAAMLFYYGGQWRIHVSGVRGLPQLCPERL